VSISRVIGLGVQNPAAAQPGRTGGDFGLRLQRYLEQLNAGQTGADTAARKLASGQTHYLHETMIALEKADIQFRLAMAVRNKVISAYQEIMRMQF
jgi:flagellar hook-basal body complex protein FliE